MRSRVQQRLAQVRIEYCAWTRRGGTTKNDCYPFNEAGASRDMRATASAPPLPVFHHHRVQLHDPLTVRDGQIREPLARYG